MKITNKSITIKIGNKEHEFRNYIYDSYLEVLANSLFDVTEDKSLGYCFVKFSPRIYPEDEYDLYMIEERKDTDDTFTDNSVVTTHRYELFDDGDFDYSPFYNRKIDKLYFGQIVSDEPVFYAVLDLNDYNYYFTEGQIISVKRIDQISTEMEFVKGTSNINYPLHLAQNRHYEQKAQLIGLGKTNTKGILDNYTSIQYLNIDIEENVIIIHNQTIYNTGYAIFPSNDLYPNTDLYPIEATEKFIVFVFEIYNAIMNQYGEYSYTPTGKYYYEYVETDKVGNIDIKLKYERGENNE